MQLLFYQVLAFTALASFSNLRALAATPYKGKRNWSLFSNRTILYPEDPAELQKRDGTKYVFMHHVNTFPYTYDDWLDDIQKIAANGADAIALNIGSDDWQRTQVATAYQAAQASGTGIKLFYSFDLTAMPCDLNDLVARVKLYANHPNQFKVNGKVFISSYSGDCLGNSGWASLKAQTNGYLMPFIWGLEGQFNSWPALDSWYCWGCAWPQGDYPKNTDDDNYYISQLGTRYATTISGWLYTHLSYKNFYLRGDDWLIVSRWQELMQMRDTLTFVELVTWNDYGESDYFGPIKGAQPAGITYATNFPHIAWYDLSKYYVTAFKTGTYPAITTDVIYFWARPHPAAAIASSDSLGKATGWDWTEDSMWAAVFATSSATVTLKCGSSSNTFSAPAGVTTLKIPLSPGKMTVQMVRSGQTIINYTPSDYTYITNPVLYNYNAWVGSATATVSATSSTPSTSSSTSSTSHTSTTSTSTTSSAAPTTTIGWISLGCYQDQNNRVLSNGPTADNALTITKCLAKCQSGSYKYAGVEYGDECWCSNTLNSPGATSASDCNMPCAGQYNQICGAPWHINVYQYQASPTTTSTVTSTTPTTTTTTASSATTTSTTSLSTTTSSTATTTTSKSATASPTAWYGYGCVAEGTTGSRRSLTAASYSQPNMTPQLCQNLCSGYRYAGYCGDSLKNNGATGAIIPSSNCQTTCGGDVTQKCGGGWTLNVYTTQVISAWSSPGCYVDASTRMLRGSSTSQAGMTTEICISLCSDDGYTMAATEYGLECYCGSELYQQGGVGIVASTSQCDMPCEGNSAETCGSSWRANLYLKPGTTLQ
ncbi:glycosyl hydrolase family 71-domain-containing protein [Gymnopilus junonius]|uniref:Glycosyl hydrolase family 71-domain-containing protein n=1 Tax=Gymnopilus junonius TaxID=109634 RepID=A0A9P5NND6_GYMJU|nr:glycosyl hydrolase family 71-domain-containing protein [Gymnopilus junonius]